MGYTNFVLLGILGHFLNRLLITKSIYNLHIIGRKQIYSRKRFPFPQGSHRILVEQMMAAYRSGFPGLGRTDDFEKLKGSVVENCNIVTFTKTNVIRFNCNVVTFNLTSLFLLPTADAEMHKKHTKMLLSQALPQLRWRTGSLHARIAHTRRTYIVTSEAQLQMREKKQC